MISKSKTNTILFGLPYNRLYPALGALEASPVAILLGILGCHTPPELKDPFCWPRLGEMVPLTSVYILKYLASGSKDAFDIPVSTFIISLSAIALKNALALSSHKCFNFLCSACVIRWTVCRLFLKNLRLVPRGSTLCIESVVTVTVHRHVIFDCSRTSSVC